MIFNDQAAVRLARIGRCQIGVCRIDDVLHDPDDVAAMGRAQPYGEDRTHFYPGVRAPLPESFSPPFRAWLTTLLRRAGLLDARQLVSRDESFFSVVTTASNDLLPIQRIPHYDSTDPAVLAVVIYLCGRGFGGTSFYRHRKTGYEQISAANRDNYQLALNNDSAVHGLPAKRYMNGNSALFEVIFSNPVRLNSALVYPGRLLHAADISGEFTPPTDPAEWRLTLTALLRISDQ